MPSSLSERYQRPAIHLPQNMPSCSPLRGPESLRRRDPPAAAGVLEDDSAKAFRALVDEEMQRTHTSDEPIAPSGCTLVFLFIALLAACVGVDMLSAS